ncbi:MAG: hypothetical protein JO102_03160 [Elusimicrobia bacterium]|nr:hypothetical protein [Elusimicrobiota bacterium]
MPGSRVNNRHLPYEYHGDHHFATLSHDPRSNKLNVGRVVNFSAHAAASFDIRDGKVRGTVLHTGDSHSLLLSADRNGRFRGTFVEMRRGKVEILFRGGAAALIKGNIPQRGLRITGDHHRVFIQVDSGGRLSGVIESRRVKNGAFHIRLEEGRVSGSFVHAGDKHETELSLSPTGWSASVQFGAGSAKFAMKVENGRSEAKGFVGGPARL